jgi:hypothetical protein
MLANPSPVKQAPDNRRLNKATQLILEGMTLSTPPMAQEYFEPGVNTKLTRRSKPKTNYQTPSDMPKLPLGFVPTNQTPGAAGEEPPVIKVKEAVPADLMDMFAKIAAADAVSSRLEEAAKIADKIDIGTHIAEQYLEAMKTKTEEKRFENLIRQGFSETESENAMVKLREEAALKVAHEAPKPEPVQNVVRTMLKTEAIVKSEEPPVDVALDVKEKVKGRRGRPTDAMRAEQLGISVDELKEGRRLEKRTPEKLAEFMKTGKNYPF